ncbi:methyltransferase domain-containing protein [Spongiimicrobium sp. 3-5]|uniref:methyltransferase domain-containing protein n=1 Tax=Spongiimicrobium sp. 3-5 TaxID=3332596 RepID=UPI00397FF6DA
MNFKTRNTESELMDDPNLDEPSLLKVLKDINTSNKLLGGTKITLRAMLKLMDENPREVYTVVDMGCGDGEMLREAALLCREKKHKANLVGIDLSNAAIKIAKERSSGFPEITFLQQDILTLNTSTFVCDILLCTLTMHHFSNQQIPVFLTKFGKLARIGTIVNDLQRSSLAYALFKAFSAIFIKTKIAKHDGLVSIQSGFTKKELVVFSKGLQHLQHAVHWKWAFRYLWVITPPATDYANE